MIFSWILTFEARAIKSYALRGADLAIFRILYSSYILVAVLPVAIWLPHAPKAFFNPPISLAALFTSTPPPSVLFVLNLLLSLFASMLLVGWRTGVASAGTGLILLTLDSWAYSLGKINHDILLVITPLVLGFSSWGRSLLRRRLHAAQPHLPGTGRSCSDRAASPARGVAMFTAGWAKAATGWLDVDRG